MTIHVCFTRYDVQKVEVIPCPTCKSEQSFLCRFQEWYGWTSACLNCGDQWQDGKLCPRPFRRGWRKEAVETARKVAAELGLMEVQG